MQSSSQTRLETFPLATSPLSNTRLNVLAFVARGPASRGDVEDGCALAQATTWRTVGELESSGYLIETVRRRYQITPNGRMELARFHTYLSLIIAGMTEISAAD